HAPSFAGCSGLAKVTVDARLEDVHLYGGQPRRLGIEQSIPLGLADHACGHSCIEATVEVGAVPAPTRAFPQPGPDRLGGDDLLQRRLDRKSTRPNSSHVKISYAV